MLSTHMELLAAGEMLGTLKQFVTDQKLHPILVNFTAALVPVSLASDVLGRLFRRDSLRAAGWWTICFAALITPLTVAAGWLFWMPDDEGVRNMTIHKWLGTSLAVVFLGLAFWRWWFHHRDRRPSWTYLAVIVLIVGALAYQGHLGGDQSFGSMDEPDQAEHAHADGSTGQHGSAGKHMDMPMQGAAGQPAQPPDNHGLRWQDHIDVKDSDHATTHP